MQCLPIEIPVTLGVNGCCESYVIACARARPVVFLILLYAFYSYLFKIVSLQNKINNMGTIIINNASKEQASLISKLAKMLRLPVIKQKQGSQSSKAAIDAAIEDYENGSSAGFEMSVKEFKKMLNGIKQDN